MQTGRQICTPAALAGLAVAALGSFELSRWTVESWEHYLAGKGYVPMAPITAVLFVMLGLATLLRFRWPEASLAPRVLRAVVVLTVVVATAVLVQSSWNVTLPWDAWLRGGIPLGPGSTVGRMSPYSAMLFLLTAIALLFDDLRSVRSSWAAWKSYLAAGALFFASLVAASYLSGFPLFYSTANVPVALPTAAAFILLNLGLLYSGLVAQLVREWRSPTSSNEVGPGGRAVLHRLVLLTAAFVALLMLVGFFYLRSSQQAAREAVHEHLRAISDLKVDQLVAWCNERRRDSLLLARHPALAERIAALAAAPESARVEDPLVNYFETLRTNYRYRAISILDAALRPVLTTPPGRGFEFEDPQSLRESLVGSGGVVMRDLHVGPDGDVHLDFVASVARPADGAFAGAVCISVGAADVFFPLIQRWPTSSASAETLLVKREGDMVVFLNELRYRAKTTLSLRLPLTLTEVLAVKALVGGKMGLNEGVDYRGVQVVGVSRPVPDSPWVMIAKMDLAEAYQPVSREFWRIGWLLALSLFAGGLMVRALWLQQQHEFERRRLSDEVARQSAVARLGLVLRHANDIILLLDEDNRVVEASERALAAYGYSSQEFNRLSIRQLRSREALGTIEQDLQAAQTGDVVFETTHQRKDGSVFPVEVSSRQVLIDGRPHLLSIVRDITERREQQREIERLNRLYSVISEVNQALVKQQTREALLQEVCRVLVERGGFKIAWVGWLNRQTELIECLAVAGDEKGYVAGLRVSARGDLPEGCGPAGTAFRAGRPHVCNDFLADPKTGPWRSAAAASGLLSSIALPIRQEGEIVGLLTAYSGEREFFHAKEVELLEKAAGDVSFALDVFATEARRRAAELTLHEQTRELRRRNEELSRFNRVAIGREIRMIELKREINALAAELGRPAPYPLGASLAATEPTKSS